MVVGYLLFSCVSMSHIPVSDVIISDGVVIGAFNMRFIGLYRILCTCVSSAFVGIHVSAPYVSAWW